MELLPIALPPTPATPPHALGPVANDWEAAEAWLRAIGNRARRNSPQTVATYRQHLAKLRWYCENVMRTMPSRWAVTDVDAFIDFLKQLPDDALCAQDSVTGRYANADEAGYTPFRCAPSASSRSDIQRCVHAMFKAWREVGYIQINPMGLHGAGTVRKINTNRAVTLDLFDLVLETIDAEPKETFEQRQKAVRDAFVFIARANWACAPPNSSKRPWERSAGCRTQRITALTGYACGRKDRQGLCRAQDSRHEHPIPRADGLPGSLRHVIVAGANDRTPLLLSPRTRRSAISARGKPIKAVESRRFLGAWRSVTSRHGLYYIVKERLAQTARFLESVDDLDRAEHVQKASPHWLRHTFAKSALLKGQSVREVASLLGHSSVGTTMIYTDQEAIDLVMAMERAAPGTVAADSIVKE